MFKRVGVFIGVDQMGADVILDHFGHQSGHGATRARDELHDLFAFGLALERALDRFHLPPETAHAGEQLLLFTNGMGHGPKVA